ncbi:AsmA-like C-terminal region-containing protein [Bosea sp. AAP35]|uniref:AsmA family protein n=1 Tax=Bosea sp. AAP35 TaxID=1523417 RepID=UPI000A63FDAA|nr:AsmA-like C-terminal region-containing protein [Bosea sp. AAP35]
MTRRTSILAYSLVLVLGLLGLQSWGIAVARVEKHVIAAIEARTGLVVSGLERAEIALLPLPRISLSQVAFAQREGPVAGRALRIRAQAQLLPLLAGRLDFSRIELVAPQIDVAVSADSESLAEWLAAPLDYLEGLRGQSRIVITAGAIFLRAPDTIRTILRDVNLVLAEREPQDALTVSGSLTWRGVPAEIGLLWPVAMGRGKTTLSVNAPLLKLQFDGIRSSAPEPITTGQLTLSTRSLPELLGWFGETPRLATAIGAFSLTSEARIRPHDTALTNVVARLDGDRLDGALNLNFSGGRPSLSGTLAGAQLDLGRAISRLDIAAPDHSPAAAALPFEAWTTQDIDLRVSVEAARLNGGRLTDVATYLLVKKGRFEAGILRAGAYGGSAKGRLLATTTTGGIDIKTSGALDRINLGQAGGDLPQLARLTGTGALQFSLDGLGRALPEILASLSGKAVVSLRQGDVAGFAFGDLLRRAERNPALALRDWRQGKTTFETAGASAIITNGVLTLNDAQMLGPGYRLTLIGTAALADRTLDMAALLQPLTGPLRLPFSLSGPFDAPAFELEAESMLRPIGATGVSPLLLR